MENAVIDEKQFCGFPLFVSVYELRRVKNTQYLFLRLTAGKGRRKHVEIFLFPTPCASVGIKKSLFLSWKVKESLSS